MSVNQTYFVDAVDKVAQSLDEKGLCPVVRSLVELTNDGQQEVVGIATRFGNNYFFKEV